MLFQSLARLEFGPSAFGITRVGFLFAPLVVESTHLDFLPLVQSIFQVDSMTSVCAASRIDLSLSLQSHAYSGLAMLIFSLVRLDLLVFLLDSGMPGPPLSTRSRARLASLAPIFDADYVGLSMFTQASA